MPIAPELRAALYNTPAWRELQAQLRDERAGGQCECKGQCGRNHLGKPGSRCPEFHGTVAQESRGTVRLALAHWYQSETGRMVDASRLIVFCQACHLRWDMESHLAARHRNRMRRAVQRYGQRDMWEHA